MPASCRALYAATFAPSMPVIPMSLTACSVTKGTPPITWMIAGTSSAQLTTPR
jgi:hypothetical protein